MTTIAQLESKVETLAAQVAELVSTKQDVNVHMSAEERAGVERGLRQADAGQFATQADVDKMWAKYV